MPPDTELFDPTAEGRGGYNGRQNLLRLVLIISIIFLGFVVWQAIQYSQSPSAPAVVQQPIVTTDADTNNQSFDEINQHLQQDLAKSKQATQALKRTETNNERHTKAALWWIGAVVLVFHILNVLRLLKKLAEAYAKGQANYAKHNQLMK